MTYELFIAIAVILWLASLAACAVAWFTKRFVASLILCFAAFAIAYAGLTRFHLSASKTVNNQTIWKVDSHWFFIMTLVVATISLVYAIWRHRTVPKIPQPNSP